MKIRFLLKRPQQSGVLWYWSPPRKLRGMMEPQALGKTATPEPTETILSAAMELNRTYDGMHSGPVQGTLAWVICRYLADRRFESLASGTQVQYRHTLKYLQNQPFASAPVVAFTRQHALALYDRHRATPRKAEELVKIMRILFYFARDLGLVQHNVFEKLRVKKNPPRREIWTQQQVQTAKGAAVEAGLAPVALAIQLALDTGQRPSDVLAMTWNQYDGSAIRLRQQKTGVWLEIPVTRELKSLLGVVERKAVVMVHSTTGRAYRAVIFSRVLREVCNAAGLPRNLQFRDLRRTAVVRMGESGCEPQEISAITGHNLDDTLKILETYMPRTLVMAQNAIRKVEKLKKLKASPTKS